MMKKIGIIAVMIILALTLCSCGAGKNGENETGEDLTPTSSLTIDEEEAAVLNEKVPVVLYFGDEKQEKLIKEIRYIDIKEAKKGAEHLASAMIKELIAGPKAQGLRPLIAEGTTLRAPVTLENRIARVDFTKEFIDNHPGGKALAELTVYSVVNTLTEMKEIERVKIIINGKETKNFKDNVTLSSDFPRNDAIINKEVGLAIPEDGGLTPVDVSDEVSELSGTEGEDPLE